MNFQSMSLSPSLILPHSNSFLTPLVQPEPSIPGLIPIPNLLFQFPTNPVLYSNFSSHGNGPAGSTWIPDSGANFHVTGDSENIKQFPHFDGPD